MAVNGRVFFRRPRPSFSRTRRSISRDVGAPRPMIAAGVHGLIMLGTVGENCSLEYAEKLEVLRATVEHVGGPRARADRRRRVHDGAGLPVRRATPQRPGSTA